MALPSKLTHEEQALLNKFALLKKRKKEIVPIKANHSNAPGTLKTIKKRESLPSEKVKIKTITPKDAKEKAKELLASGKIKIENTEKRSFKRARPVHAEKKVKPALSENTFLRSEQNKKIDGIKKESYNNFVSGSNKVKQADGSPTKRDFRRNDFNRRQGNSLYVQGHGLTKQLLDAEFPRFGAISSIYMEAEKSHATVTFEEKESAENAIKELHGNMVKGVILRVMYSRKRPYDDNRFTYRTKGPKLGDEKKPVERMDFDRQPLDQPDQSQESTPTEAKRKVVPDKRQLVTYDDEEDFF